MCLSSLLLLGPALVLVLSITVYPLVFTFSWSLYSSSYLVRGTFLGFQHYMRFFAYEGKHAFLVSLVYTGGSLLGALGLGTAIAFLLNQRIQGRTLFRTILLTPWVLSQTIVALLWKWFLDPYYGPLATVLRHFGLSGIAFLSSPRTALSTLILINVWSTYPQVVVLLLAALQTIPKEVIEASIIDGATRIRRFIHVIFPYLRHQYLVAMLLLGTLYFNMVTLIYVATAGGPARATETVSVLLFKTAFEQWRLSYASAISVLMIVINLLISIVYIKMVRRA